MEIIVYFPWGYGISQVALLLGIMLILGETGGGIGMRNCLLSHKLCANDPSCRSILEIIPRVCGPETVACSTVTVNKCLAALRTVRGFPYFYPVCLCREPHLDRNCNAFREFIFDHPCEFVYQGADRPPYAVDALPTCDYAAKTCHQLTACHRVYDRFKRACRVREGHCRMQDSDACLLAWTELKQLPMFGCICPSDVLKQKCDKIFSIVHHNPCVDAYLASSALPNSREGKGGAWGIIKPPASPPYLSPHATAQPYPVPPLHRTMHVPYYLPATPSPPYSLQTSNVLNIPIPTFLGNNPGSFPVSVIPLNNSSYYGLSTKVRNPLVDSARGRSPQNVSPAVSVLGRDRLPSSETTSKFSVFYGNRLPNLNSTCKTALDGCLAYPGCRRLLNPVLASCGITSCRRERCMDDLQIFYRNVENRWALEIAFCLCKKTNLTSDDCLIAQEKLHPTCARKPVGNVPLMCSTLARSCKEDNSCRHRLEFYEQACAVDSDTQRCAGPATECRRALLGILGTRLRNICTCASPNTKETFACMDWQRILWFNPCIVESQTDYHREMLSNLQPGVRITTSSSIVQFYPTSPPWRHTENSYLSIVNPHSPFEQSTPNSEWKPMPSTSTTTTTTTPAPEYCRKKLRNGKMDYIAEGESKRYYKEIDSCSELCQCFIGKNLVCNVIECVPSIPCATSYAVYIHAAPAYQASRGECVCYSEDFICVRPPEEEFTLNEGLYLLIGYSKKEEELLRPWTHQGVRDTIPRLRRIYQEALISLNGSQCQLDPELYSGENIIIQASLSELTDRDNMTGEMLNKEKEACEPALRSLSSFINTKNPATHQDPLLSMFLLSEVQVRIPPVKAAAQIASSSWFLSIILLIFLIFSFPL